MKSKLQDGDVCELENGLRYTVEGNSIVSYRSYVRLNYYTEELKRNDGVKKADIIRVTRDGVVIWERSEPINKMMTVEVNGETYPLATHENMKILVDKISELELRIKNLENEKT